MKGSAMRRLRVGLRELAALAAQGRGADIASRLAGVAWSDRYWLVLRRDLTRDAPRPASPVPFSVRPYEPRDTDSLFDRRSPAERAEWAKRQRWMKRGLSRCYVAVLADGRATFMQWLCTPDDNPVLRELFPFAAHVVPPGAVLLEGAYTPPRYRRIPIMPAAMAEIAERGRQLGARAAVVYVEEDNTSMIRAAEMAGFTVWRRTIARRRLGLQRFREVSGPRRGARSQKTSATSAGSATAGASRVRCGAGGGALTR